MKSIKAIVKGRVQGVWYRGSTQEKAQEICLSGYVKNLSNGDVEIVATGESTAIETLINWAWQGPPHAVVEHIELTPLSEHLSGPFRIRY